MDDEDKQPKRPEKGNQTEQNAVRLRVINRSRLYARYKGRENGRVVTLVTFNTFGPGHGPFSGAAIPGFGRFENCQSIFGILRRLTECMGEGEKQQKLLM